MRSVSHKAPIHDPQGHNRARQTQLQNSLLLAPHSTTTHTHIHSYNSGSGGGGHTDTYTHTDMDAPPPPFVFSFNAHFSPSRCCGVCSTDAMGNDKLNCNCQSIALGDWPAHAASRGHLRRLQTRNLPLVLAGQPLQQEGTGYWRYQCLLCALTPEGTPLRPSRASWLRRRPGDVHPAAPHRLPTRRATTACNAAAPVAPQP